MKKSKFESVKTVSNKHEAEIIKGKLISEGIECYIVRDDNTAPVGVIGVDLPYTPYVIFVDSGKKYEVIQLINS